MLSLIEKEGLYKGDVRINVPVRSGEKRKEKRGRVVGLKRICGEDQSKGKCSSNQRGVLGSSGTARTSRLKSNLDIWVTKPGAIRQWRWDASNQETRRASKFITPLPEKKERKRGSRDLIV